MAVGEALTNMAGCDVQSLNRIKLSANWMAAAGHPGEDAGLYDAVKPLVKSYALQLGITIPVGKDSMSMKTLRWQDEQGKTKEVISPLSLVITAFSRVEDVRKTVTPELSTQEGNRLYLIDFR